MKTTRLSSIVSVCLNLFLLLLPLIAESAPGEPVEKLLPTPGFTEGWTMKEKIITYTENNLYKYINGEAELYYPYGFKALATTVYVRIDNPETGIVADIYEMGSPIDAFGIYSRYRDRRTASQCINCSDCVAHCVNGLNIAEKMRQARTHLA